MAAITIGSKPVQRQHTTTAQTKLYLQPGSSCHHLKIPLDQSLLSSLRHMICNTTAKMYAGMVLDHVDLATAALVEFHWFKGTALLGHLPSIPLPG